MNQEKTPQRKNVVILDLALNYLTKDQARELSNKIQDYFPGQFRVLPVANKKHLSSICQSSEDIYLLLIGKENSREMDFENLSFLIGKSENYLFLRDWSITSLNQYAEKISTVINKSNFKPYKNDK
ncbi:hypothetical protein J4465_01205 [Candidatus Pacearchaeota archaeon]|nr:hypothetical protein [Candidatus Pacearchaeota archaeon]